MGDMEGESTFEAHGPAGSLRGWRRGVGRKLLLLHGGPGLSEYLGGLTDELADGYEVYRYQQRGLPPSTTSGPFTIEDHIEDAVAVMDHIDPGPIIVVGHSWGGHLAMFLTLDHADRMAGAVMIDPLGAVADGGMDDFPDVMKARIPPDELARAEELDGRAMQGEGTAEEALESLRLLWPGYFADPATAPPMPDMNISVPCYSQTGFSIQAHQAAGTLATRLPAVRLPMLFILGAGSPIPPRHGERSAALVPGARARVLDGCGHLMWMEQPGVVRAAIDDFVAGL